MPGDKNKYTLLAYVVRVVCIYVFQILCALAFSGQAVVAGGVVPSGIGLLFIAQRVQHLPSARRF